MAHSVVFVCMSYMPMQASHCVYNTTLIGGLVTNLFYSTNQTKYDDLAGARLKCVCQTKCVFHETIFYISSLLNFKVNKSIKFSFKCL